MTCWLEKSEAHSNILFLCLLYWKISIAKVELHSHMSTRSQKQKLMAYIAERKYQPESFMMLGMVEAMHQQRASPFCAENQKGNHNHCHIKLTL